MGAGSSSAGPPPASQRQSQDEALATLTTPLPVLRAAFSSLSSPSALRHSLSLPSTSFSPASSKFADVAARLGASIASLFFVPAGGRNGDDDGKQLGWGDFLRGYNRCCASAPVSQSVNSLLRVFATTCVQAGLDTSLSFEPSGDGEDDSEEGKVGGSLSGEELLLLFNLCWVMDIVTEFEGDLGQEVALPEFSHLVNSVLVSGGAVPEDENLWDLAVSEEWSRMSVPVQKFHAWVIAMTVGLGRILSQYVQKRIQACASLKGTFVASTSENATSIKNYESVLLQRGVAWAVSLSVSDNLRKQLLRSSLSGRSEVNLLYRASVHGKGLSRFWSCMEGYNGPVIVLLSSKSTTGDENNPDKRRWVIGMLIEQGFQNRDVFYGTSGSLYAVSPIFRVLKSTGREKNIVYCHLRPPVRVYEAVPKLVALAFGGALGNERIFIDEDFGRVVLRHHAVDKTYQPGSLIPNQGFLPVEAPILEIEAWGLGGNTAIGQQGAFKERQKLFTDQRRKVDLKAFGSWEDSPEKMMMDMMSDPNRVRREDR